MEKQRQLVAWTENGQIHMIPSLVQQMAQPFLERIAELESLRPFHYKEQPHYLISLSRAYEALGLYYERVGHIREAFDAYVAAALAVTEVDDYWWCDCDEGFVLSQPFRGRFFTVYGQCRKLLYKHPYLRDTAACESLMHDFIRLTKVSERWHDEFIEAIETVRAWSFQR